MRKDIDSRLSSTVPSSLKFDFKQHEKGAEHHSYKGNDLKKRKGPGEFSSAHTEKEAENERPFNSFDKSDEKRRRKDDPSKLLCLLAMSWRNQDLLYEKVIPDRRWKVLQTGGNAEAGDESDYLF
ncbi:hypothetical protein NL676_006549 [Syzygium grande]|nr:hypothetical protein NL676_006549 [Syzygium grande]